MVISRLTGDDYLTFQTDGNRGKECVIKFEKVVPGRFRTLSDSGEKLSECKSILLEFMEHDKPEVELILRESA